MAIALTPSCRSVCPVTRQLIPLGRRMLLRTHVQQCVQLQQVIQRHHPAAQLAQRDMPGQKGTPDQ
ncbi:Hypothetical protein GbCGDNIH1_8025 [Granulibacter bethesdensis CGDNIH1]|uniref:Uncharacterized protein n=1 Tax=Granulibacter bethesdensis (strain ATCC BAA-1260 / CGDNIH1) TaxID=391165 RepID=A0A286M347_GRABC|nr:Hypothetical protein GbCGDNIH5_8025 [Granulibacter bethesdensis]APH65004.1 Hypothetical protein GbCGDNIH1I4_8025 [Granulibacter bethesdensis]ASV62446.1 Hypothetical protein GbCGDNIH1_8025 [Granulibacter bethesdensis CGDNIH1]